MFLMKLVLQTHQQPIRGRNYQGALLRSLGLPATLLLTPILTLLAGEEDQIYYSVEVDWLL